MDKTTGGAAFPDPGRAQSAKQREQLTETGMTLRDYFAAKAMMAQIINTDKRSAEEADLWVAGISYQIADAMLAARGAA